MIWSSRQCRTKNWSFSRKTRYRV